MNKTHTQWIKNPDTNRLIKVGGPTWRNLVKKGILDGIVKNPKTNVVETKDELVTTLEPVNEREVCKANFQGGKPPLQKNKKQNRLAHKEITEMSATAAINTIKQHYSSLAEELEDIAYIDDEDEYNQRMSTFHKDVEQMIYQQLLSKKEIPREKKEMEYESEYTLVESEA